MNDQTPGTFAATFELFCIKLEEMINQGSSAINLIRIEKEEGPKYIRVITADVRGSSRSAYAFINKETGDILKPASYKGPAKGARGNIFNANQLSGCGKYGVAHMR